MIASQAAQLQSQFMSQIPSKLITDCVGKLFHKPRGGGILRANISSRHIAVAAEQQISRLLTRDLATNRTTSITAAALSAELQFDSFSAEIMWEANAHAFSMAVLLSAKNLTGSDVIANSVI